jgi:zinc transporter ZupT
VSGGADNSSSGVLRHRRSHDHDHGDHPRGMHCCVGAAPDLFQQLNRFNHTIHQLESRARELGIDTWDDDDSTIARPPAASLEQEEGWAPYSKAEVHDSLVIGTNNVDNHKNSYLHSGGDEENHPARCNNKTTVGDRVSMTTATTTPTCTTDNPARTTKNKKRKKTHSKGAGGKKGGGGDNRDNKKGSKKKRRHADEAERAEARKLTRMSINTAIAIGLHNLPEGLATFVASMNDPKVGAVLAIAIAMHNIPEGLCVALPMYYATQSKWKAFGYAVLSGMAEPFAALLGWAVLARTFSHTTFGVLFGMVAGMMVIISARELLPTAHRYDPEDAVVTYSFMGGMAVISLSLILFLV